jgi:hypothetical protein
MNSNPAVVGPYADQCDIVLFVVENLCRGKTPAVPGTPYLLFVMVEGPDGDAMLARAAGITEDAQLRFAEQGIPLLRPSTSMEKMLNTYFDLSWERFQEQFQEQFSRKHNIMPLGDQIQ